MQEKMRIEPRWKIGNARSKVEVHLTNRPLTDSNGPSMQTNKRSPRNTYNGERCVS